RWILLQRFRDGLRVHCLPPLDLDFRRLDAKSLAQFSPSLAKLAAIDKEGLLTRRQKIRDRGLHSPRAAGNKRQHIGFSLKEPFQILADLSEERREFRRPMVNDRTSHGQQDFRRDLGWPRG